MTAEAQSWDGQARLLRCYAPAVSAELSAYPGVPRQAVHFIALCIF